MKDRQTLQPPAAILESEVVSTAEGLLLLRSEWEDLAARAHCHVSATPAWALAGWDTVAAPRGAELRVIVVRQAGRLAAVWPLVRYRHGLTATLVPLGSESSEYPDILAEPDAHDMAVGRAAWGVATTLGDVLVLRYVRHGSLLDRLARSARRPAARHTVAAPWICFERHPDFGAYLAGVSKARRSSLRRKRQSLARLGALEFGMPERPGDRAEIVDWLLARKREWLRRKGLRSLWLDTPEYGAFLHRVAARTDPAAPVRIFTLRLDGKLIAALLGTVDRAWLEFYLTGYDPAWARFSPGGLILADCIGRAHARGLRFDVRVGDESYKSIWANRQSSVTTFRVALTAIGLAPVAWQAARLSPGFIRRQLRPWWQRRKAILEWLQQFGRRKYADPGR